jgi:autotransporter-associated beta strand protein
MWLTEWNDGASWCSPLPGSPAADATSISNFVNMLESAPFVERYSIYQWFDPASNLNLLTTNSSPALTPAGAVYLNMPSKVAYTQVLPASTSRGIAQFHFDNDALDSSGYANNGFVVGDPNYVAGPVNQAIALDGINSFIQLSANVANGSVLSFVAWVYWNGGANGQRIFDFGDDTTHYLYLSPSSSSGTFRFAIRNGGSDQILETTALPIGQWMHIAVTLSGNTARLYTNGVQAAVSTSISIAPSSITPAVNYLGKSQSGNDPLFSGNLDEVQIADSVFTPSQIASLMTDSPPQFLTNFMIGDSSTQSVVYSSSIAGTAFDSDPGDTLTYSKISGPAWLNVAADGTLSGTPTPSDGGTNVFTVRVMDSTGASAFAGLAINIVAFNANGVWNVDASGTWSDTNNWIGGAIANGAGFAADFSAIDITANRTVTLDAARSIGTIKFGDTSGTESWVLSSGSALTLDTGSDVSPSLVVNQNTATISAVLAGNGGFTKSGAGTLVLSGNNIYSGNTIVNGGPLTIGASGRLGGGAYSGNITDNSALNFNSSAAQTLSGSISGSGSLTQASGTLTLSAANTYSGGTTINGGTLNLAIGGGTGAIRNNLTINPGATVNLTSADALGYTASSPAVYVTNVNITGGTLNIGSTGNEAYRTAFYLTGGTMSSSGGGSYHFDGTTGGSLNSLPNSTASIVSGGITLRNTGVVFSAAQGSVPGGIDLNISGVIGEQFGSFGFTKAGAGTLALSAVNTNSGATLVAAGTLLVNGSIKSAAPVTIANLAILGGKGVIYGPVTIQAGGTLAPGTNSAAVGTLTINNVVILQSGSTNRIKIRKAAPMTNDMLLASGGLTYGGTLVITNLAGTLTVGDTFKLFSSPTYLGDFSSIIPATPGSGLLWDMDNLEVDGTLSIKLGNAIPQFGTISLNGSNLVFNGSGGTAGTAFSILASTNLAIPLTDWTVIGSGLFDTDGNFTFTNDWTPDAPQKVFSIRIP